ncbi:protein HAIKU1-like [Phalaenopsis equestris]|uniref:protein HAIKU1-like n=1 Tax=Phalaenopsis equestris TaxID=78828 RepID=UPI0009E262E2|nr:protein HAIKU1-like [Phalaenopsis equestris]
MDQNSKTYHHHPLGVNKLGKSIRKSPLHQPNFHKLPPPATATPPPPPPQVYNISKSDFRTIVQRLTGSPARDPAGPVNVSAQARPPQPKPPSSRLMKIRPPPLNPISRPPPLPLQSSAPNQNPNPNPGFYPRPAQSPAALTGAAWTDSPVSAYMRYLETSLLSADSSRRAPAQGLLPAHFPSSSSPRGNPPSYVSLSPRGNPPYASSVPASMQPGLLLSPGSQFLLPSPNSLSRLPSPSSFLNLLSPKSPYPILSPGFQYPQPFSPNFSFSPLPQSGLLGPGSQPPPSPTLLFPPSPSGFLPLTSPRWRDM